MFIILAVSILSAIVTLCWSNDVDTGNTVTCHFTISGNYICMTPDAVIMKLSDAIICIHYAMHSINLDFHKYNIVRVQQVQNTLFAIKSSTFLFLL